MLSYGLDYNLGKHSPACGPGLYLQIFASFVVIKVLLGDWSSVYRSKDPHLPAYPMIVVLHYVHNHPIMAADALKHRKVADETLTREKFLDLFKSGHSPSTALESHRYTQYVVALVIAGIFHFSHTRGQTNLCDPQ